MIKQAGDVQANLHDIQGNLLRAYRHPHAVYSFWQFKTADIGRVWLSRVLELGVTNSSIWSKDISTGKIRKPEATLNLAFTFLGLTTLEVTPVRLAKLPRVYREGMRARAEKLGDIGANDPVHWQDGLGDDQIHVLVTINAATPEVRESHLMALREIVIEGISEISSPLSGDAPGDHREHFGFSDGIGQPSIDGGFANKPGMGTPTEHGWKALMPGEFLLGYENEDGGGHLDEQLQPLCENGTYIVLRKLEQNVKAFRTFLPQGAMDAFGSSDKVAQTRLGANMIGRWPSGAPLTDHPEQDPGEASNDFRYKDDVSGSRCPLGAHIRRCNPRDGNTGGGHVPFHRIIRRGMPYGPEYNIDPEAERGVIFLALNASIEKQFEFIQTEWIDKGDFIFLDEEKDPLLGTNTDSDFTMPGATASTRIFGLNQFVTNRGGGYFLSPGIAALKRLAEGTL